MATNSKRKGKRGENLACKLLETFGISARRSQQYSGVKDDNSSADILTDLDDKVRLEVKFGYKKELYHKAVQEWIEIAKAETPDDKAWAILYKRKRSTSWELIFEVDGVICKSADVENALQLIT